MKSRRSAFRWVGKLLGGVLTLALLALLYLVLIVGQPQEAPETPVAQPSLTASPALAIDQEADLKSLAETFPVPIMSFMSGSGNAFVSGTSADAVLEDGFGRVLTLYWQTLSGQPMILQSIYPADGYSLLGKGDYAISATPGPALFGHATVRMENQDTVRIHTVTDTGLYAVTIPAALAPELRSLCSSLQLFTTN